MDKLKEYFKDWLNSHMFLKDKLEYITVYELALFFEYCSKREEIEKNLYELNRKRVDLINKNVKEN